jgi:hypothetical protein
LRHISKRGSSEVQERGTVGIEIYMNMQNVIILRGEIQGPYCFSES